MREADFVFVTNSAGASLMIPNHKKFVGQIDFTSRCWTDAGQNASKLKRGYGLLP